MVLEPIAEIGGEGVAQIENHEEPLSGKQVVNGDDTPSTLCSPEGSIFQADFGEAMNGDAGAGPTMTTITSPRSSSTPQEESCDDSFEAGAADEDELLLPDDEVDHVCVGQSRSVLPMSGQLCGYAAAKEFIGGTTTRTLILADDSDLGSPEEAPPDDEMEHTMPQHSGECLRNGLSAIGCEGRFKIDMDSAAPCPMRPVGPTLRDPRSQGQAETSDDKFLAPCPGISKDDKGDKDMDSSKSPKVPHKKRTWKYYPPPSNDTDAVPIDVIDHESEVLIIRREPPPRPKGTSSIGASSFCQSY